ncbi:hypothetical protein A7J05_35960 [Streptomyces alfalfae]|uniref:Uncharacterized protein n=1 Tax=Streptomyces alfalfae TaxID=1642299 RepID=A0ABN4VUS2_9ACTN|nr:hypothetical protein A7J05_35960 [Streptomyces alfalfae]AYA20803.1 hypothetical protein D3X13_35375 [Streptomyces fradiae]
MDDNPDYRAAKVDAYLARALADRSDQSGHYADPAASAVGSLPMPVCARTGSPVDGGLEFVGRLAQAGPDATNALAAWLENVAAAQRVAWRERCEGGGGHLERAQ